jgi:FMN phosphatase YigB (HAD superfamily)
MVLLLDAANTLIHKPDLYGRFMEVLEQHNIVVDPALFIRQHRILTELIVFPDKTNKDFYHHFNRELLYSLGVMADEQLLEDIFSKCSYLPWKPFEDVRFLDNWNGPIGVLSNFHSGLTDILGELIPGRFSSLIISERSKFRKPEAGFFNEAIAGFGVPASDIVYIGDSIRLDLEPGLKAGMNAWLIDRDNTFPACSRKISSFEFLSDCLS